MKGERDEGRVEKKRKKTGRREEEVRRRCGGGTALGGLTRKSRIGVAAVRHVISSVSQYCSKG